MVKGVNMSKADRHVAQYMCLRLDEQVTIEYKQKNGNIKFIDCKNRKHDVCDGCYLHNLFRSEH